VAADDSPRYSSTVLEGPFHALHASRRRIRHHGRLGLQTGAGEIKTDIPGIGNEKVLISLDEPTTAGSFDGTWLYVNRDSRFGIWIREKDGLPQVKVQYQSLANPEAFETDWDGKALYYLGEHPVTFELKLTERTADRIQGKWSWVLDGGDASRKETADVVLFRTDYGRTMQINFQNFERVIYNGVKNKIMRTPMVWTWNKISKRELMWDEFPF
jgi:hypothetical protein